MSTVHQKWNFDRKNGKSLFRQLIHTILISQFGDAMYMFADNRTTP